MRRVAVLVLLLWLLVVFVVLAVSSPIVTTEDDDATQVIDVNACRSEKCLNKHQNKMQIPPFLDNISAQVA